MTSTIVPKLSEEVLFRMRNEGKCLSEFGRFRLIDLFAGAGGMTLGFTECLGHCFQPVWANDINDYAAETYNSNFGKHCVSGDIVDILLDPNIVIPKAEVVIGGPPCQGFSLLNKNRDNDPRKHLWKPFLDVVERCEATVFVMENVPQLLGTKEHEEIEEKARELGFTVKSEKLCASDYGVPQTRWRAFIIGFRGDTFPDFIFPPKRTHYNPKGIIRGTQY